VVNENCLAVSVFCIQFINGLFLLSTLEYSMVSSHKYVLEPTTVRTRIIGPGAKTSEIPSLG